MRLGVNIDHVATIREARYRGRGFGEPDPVEAALRCEAAGAHGITAHLREDRRHMQDRDIQALRVKLGKPLNLEIGNAPKIVDMALELRPHTVCLVPERREEVTTEGGLDAAGQIETLRPTCERMRERNIGVSLFIDPDLAQVEAAGRLGVPCIELHTGAFAEAFRLDGRAEAELEALREASVRAHALGLQVNAGHGLNLENTMRLFQVPHLVELNIGHSIISRAVLVGLEQAVREMLDLLQAYPASAE